MSQLGGDGKNLKLIIDTMGEMCQFNTKEVKGLQVSDLQGENLVNLPEVYTEQSMSVKDEHIPTNNDIKQWSHLKDVDLILQTAQASDAELPLTALHRDLLSELTDRGYGDEDNSAIIRTYDQ